MEKTNKLQAFREKAGKTQLEVAKAANMHVRLYQSYEYGVSQRAIHNALRIAEVLGTTVEALWGQDKPAQPKGVRKEKTR